MIGYFISRTPITVIKSFRQTNDVLNYKHVTFNERNRLEKKNIFQAVLRVGTVLKDFPVSSPTFSNWFIGYES